MDISVDKNSVIVFDLDDTLYNEMDYLRSAYTEIARKSEDGNWKALLAKMISLHRNKKDVFEYIFQNYGTPKSDLIHLYRNHDPMISPFKGVRKIFRKIKENSGKIGIITDGRSNTQRKKLDALHLLEFIDKIVISEETGAEKPEEQNYRIIEETFKNSAYCYIADNLRKDFIAPNQLGWKSIGLIDNGLNIHYDSYLFFDTARMPQEFVTSFKEIHII